MYGTQDMTLYDMTRHDMTRHDMTRHDTTRHDMAHKYDTQDMTHMTHMPVTHDIT